VPHEHDPALGGWPLSRLARHRVDPFDRRARNDPDDAVAAVRDGTDLGLEPLTDA
jgi:hypothetical protein